MRTVEDARNILPDAIENEQIEENEKEKMRFIGLSRSISNILFCCFTSV
jgi:hypothetical protein